MNNLRRVKLGSFFTQSVAGEWGSEPTGIDDVTVYRAADFSKDCKLNVTEGALRSVPKNKLSNRKLNRNDILVEKSGGSPTQPVGRAVIYKPESDEQVATCSNFLQRLVVDEEYSPEFVYYLMLGLYQANATLPYQQQTTGIYNLKLEEYLQTEVDTYVDRNLQEKVADILSTIDHQIDATQALIDKYTAIKQGMMADLFSRGIDPETKALRPTFEKAAELYHETPLGMLPKGWVCAPIKKFVQSAEYGISTSLNDDSSGIPVLRMNNIQNNRFNVEDLKFTKDPEAYRLKLSAGDVLYNRTNSMEHVGKTAIWRGELSECSFASYLVRINVDERELLPEYFSFWMSQESSQNALRAFATPAVQQVNINPTNLQRVLMSCPVSLLEQQEIVDRIDAVDAVLLREREALLKLNAQKSGLMQDLLTGKVPVPA
ncbi:restriction endonuclease subunit S [Vibrio vulnificus]